MKPELPDDGDPIRGILWGLLLSVPIWTAVVALIQFTGRGAR